MRAWVLGAGFSVRLGGPLLRDLLTPAALRRLRFRHPESWLADTLCDTCIALQAEGVRIGLWSDAEQYIAALGSFDSRLAAEVVEACGEAARDRRPEDAEPTDFMTTLWTYARELVAAQCMNFHDEVQDELEPWLPYDRWVKSLSDDAAIISFNYDEVVETAFWRNERQLYTPNPRFGDRVLSNPGHPVLAKLHGSVTFRDTIHPGERDNIANLHHNPPFLAVPGASKADDSMTEFEEMWDFASGALEQAEQISIVGYSCPKSDEMAKAMLLDTISSNANKPPVDLVLGPRSPDAQRLGALLQAVGVDARDTSMWAEDYLSVSGAGHGWQPLDKRDEWALANQHRLPRG